jgi:hypothetical protein
MSMNFAREQSLLRQKLQAAGSPQLAAQPAGTRRQGHLPRRQRGGDCVAVRRPGIAAYPQMGRAQMTAFVRTLWQSRIHELRTVGIELLAARAALLEPADLPFLEGLLQDCDADEARGAALPTTWSARVVGKNKKLWKDLKRFANASQELLRVAPCGRADCPCSTTRRHSSASRTSPRPWWPRRMRVCSRRSTNCSRPPPQCTRMPSSRSRPKHGRKVTLPRKKAAKAAPKPTPENPAAPMPAAVMPATVIASKPPAKVSATKVGKTPAKAAAKASTKGGAKTAAKTPAKPAAKKRATTKKD